MAFNYSLHIDKMESLQICISELAADSQEYTPIKKWMPLKILMQVQSLCKQIL